MAIEQRSAAWRLVQSWYVLLTLPFGTTSWLAFLYLGMRGRRAKWFVWAAIYFGSMVYAFSRPEVAGPNGESAMPDSAGFTLLGVWIFSMLHAFVARREFLTILDARDGGAVQVPQSGQLKTTRTMSLGTSPEHIEATRTMPPGTSPEFFALFEDSSRTQAREPVFSGSPSSPSTPPPAPPAAPPPVPRAAPAARLMETPPPPPFAPPVESTPAPPPPFAPPPSPASNPAEPPPPPFSGPPPFGGRRPFDDDDDDRPPPPPPPPPPRRPGRQVDF